MIATYEDNDFEHLLVDSKLQKVYSLQYHSWAVALNRYSSFSSVDQRGYGTVTFTPSQRLTVMW